MQSPEQATAPTSAPIHYTAVEAHSSMLAREGMQACKTQMLIEQALRRPNGALPARPGGTSAVRTTGRRQLRLQAAQLLGAVDVDLPDGRSRPRLVPEHRLPGTDRPPLRPGGGGRAGARRHVGSLAQVLYCLAPVPGSTSCFERARRKPALLRAPVPQAPRAESTQHTSPGRSPG
jgi:hypothetical protein